MSSEEAFGFNERRRTAECTDNTTFLRHFLCLRIGLKVVYGQSTVLYVIDFV
jgi:hypothetical protein